jgi:hypothetical protein
MHIFFVLGGETDDVALLGSSHEFFSHTSFMQVVVVHEYIGGILVHYYKSK